MKDKSIATQGTINAAKTRFGTKTIFSQKRSCISLKILIPASVFSLIVGILIFLVLKRFNVSDAEKFVDIVIKILISLFSVIATFVFIANTLKKFVKIEFLRELINSEQDEKKLELFCNTILEL